MRRLHSTPPNFFLGFKMPFCIFYLVDLQKKSFQFFLRVGGGGGGYWTQFLPPNVPLPPIRRGGRGNDLRCSFLFFFGGFFFPFSEILYFKILEEGASVLKKNVVEK